MGLRFYFTEEKSFTLIELLVVIAIVGLLASIVLVSMQGVRERARLAKGLEFHQSLQNALGTYAVGWWSFESINGGEVIDGSGYGNDGVVTGATIVPGLERLGNALNFSGVSYVDVGTDQSLNLTGQQTIEAWVYLRSYSATYRTIYYKRSQSWLRVDGGTGAARCYFFQGGAWKNVQANDTLSLNTWYHLAVIYDNSSAKFYINGADNTKSSSVAAGGVAASLLSASISATSPWDGLIDEVRVYARSLSAAEIQKHYVDGLWRHKDLVIK